MENYIVRIYRRDASDPEQVTGMLESVEQDTRRPFKNLTTLTSMLAGNTADTPEASTQPGTGTRPSLALAK